MFKEKPMQTIETREVTMAKEAIDNAFSRITPDDIDAYGKKIKENI